MWSVVRGGQPSSCRRLNDLAVTYMAKSLKLTVTVMVAMRMVMISISTITMRMITMRSENDIKRWDQGNAWVLAALFGTAEVAVGPPGGGLAASFDCPKGAVDVKHFILGAPHYSERPV
ncbi:hypothetical protein AK812_SmicGene25189 [Symbiodinium microadriaticum]|uniref:Uncharacterized protein n=1 Tax=Symbiodinium microadriaticum TaxID=2951 RepID=A0A1Q9DCJ9_SYMMI|nr:hypothetical protein AK812_SmicGene25189 [Symbiodinium microadriaticum]